MIPSVILSTTDSAILISPDIMAHIPKPRPAGSKLGTRLIKPSFSDLSANISKKEISTSANKEPFSMLCILVSPICANMRAGLAAVTRKSGDSLLKNRYARCSKAVNSLLPRLSSVTLMRVAALSISIWLFKSRP